MADDKTVGVSHGGGKITPKPIDYSPPKGPSNINEPQSPGLHGENYGNCGTQGKR